MGISDTKLHSAGPTIQDLFDDLTDPAATSPPADDDDESVTHAESPLQG